MAGSVIRCAVPGASLCLCLKFVNYLSGKLLSAGVKRKKIWSSVIFAGFSRQGTTIACRGTFYMIILVIRKVVQAPS